MNVPATRPVAATNCATSPCEPDAGRPSFAVFDPKPGTASADPRRPRAEEESLLRIWGYSCYRVGMIA